MIGKFGFFPKIVWLNRNVNLIGEGFVSGSSRNEGHF